MTDSSRWRALGKSAALYGGAALLALLAAAAALDLPHADLRVPFCYDGDGLLVAIWVKGLVETGWVWHNPLLGQPGGLELPDFPLPDNLHLALLKLLALATGDFARTMNLFYLLTFPLAAVGALFALRRFTRSATLAFVAALLYAFLPYHLLRGEAHLFLSAYFLVPPLAMVVLWVYPEGSLFGPAGLNWRRTAAAAGVCLLASAAGVYYAFFAGALLLVAGLAAARQRRELRPLLAAAGLGAVLFVGLLGNLTPTLLYRHRHGTNPEAIHRWYGHGEEFGLKVSQLVLPLTGHRVPLLARVKHRYVANSPLVNENDMATLGAVGTAGFLLLLAWPLVRPRQGHRLLDGLALLNAAALLLATVGGVGTLVCMYLTPLIRAYNRLSVFIAFFALLAGAAALAPLARRCRRTPAGRALFAAGAAVLLAVGLLDQTSPHWAPPHAQLGQAFAEDAAFVAAVEARVPPGTKVFQLPRLPYPEPLLPSPRIGHYDHARVYLHSGALRWSYAAMKGREADRWQQRVTALPPAELVRAVAEAGFGGIYLDRHGYADDGAALEAELARLLRVPPLLHPNGHVVFYDMAAYLRDYRPAPPADQAARESEPPGPPARQAASKSG